MSAFIPNSETLKKVSSLEVLDASGKQTRFGSFFEDQRVIVVFIRRSTGHFFCGNCQLYVSQLSSEYEKLRKNFEEAQIDIVVVGCGEWQPIDNYSGVFHGLGMDVKTLARTPTGEKKASYITEGIVKGSLWSIWVNVKPLVFNLLLTWVPKRALKNPSHIGKQGNFAQLGGEFILGPGNQCSFAHRMRHTEDHAEIQVLLENAGIQSISPTNN
ncbi:hypothetical protein F5880DRAFT_1509532 [Lentinula raphanica]|nr:hypothetical protein EV360DRAFT_75344 [Lentinula raphanica]KAJ3820232.1 hypothetical protein F5880DRAFT_1509532 [Lentinula raphanica]